MAGPGGTGWRERNPALDATARFPQRGKLFSTPWKIPRCFFHSVENRDGFFPQRGNYFSTPWKTGRGQAPADFISFHSSSASSPFTTSTCWPRLSSQRRTQKAKPGITSPTIIRWRNPNS